MSAELHAPPGRTDHCVDDLDCPQPVLGEPSRGQMPNTQAEARAGDLREDRPLRVLLFSTLYPSASRPGHGGFIETRLLKLRQAGPVEARVIAPVAWFPSTNPLFGAWSRLAATPAFEERQGLAVWHPRYLLPPKVGETVAPLMLALGAWASLRRLRSSGFDFDVIDAHYFYPDGVAAALLGRWARRPVVISARGSDLHVLGTHVLPRRMMRWAADRAAASVGVCRALVDILAAWGVPPHRLHVLPNGIDLKRFTMIPRPEARRMSGMNGSPALLCVGNLVPIKGHELAIDALRALSTRYPGATLTLVGEGPSLKGLRQRAETLGVADRVRFAGRIPQDQLSAWYSAADLLLLPSRSEGWANVLLESMACGTPVVSTDVGGSSEVVSEAAGALLRGRDPEALADLVHVTLERRLDPFDVRRYAEGFDWSRTSRAQYDLLWQAAEGARP